LATSKKIKPLILDISAIEEDFFDDASLLGVFVADEDYHAIWLINNYFCMNFLPNKMYNEQLNYEFNQYEYYCPKHNLQHYIYTNRKNGNILLRGQRGYHLLWLIKGEDDRYFFIEEIKEMCSKIDNIDHVNTLDLDTIADKHLLIC
jgi:hypothetical protein